MMHAAQVSAWGQAPKYVEVPTPPAVDSTAVQIKVAATGLHRVVRSRAAGTHYSAKSLPHTPGIDGTGTTPDGQSVYFFTFGEQGAGSFTELVNVPTRNISPLPKHTDMIQAAAFVNPAMSSWMALRARTRDLPSRFSILIMGATSASGSLAVPLARALGAGRVLGCARNERALAELELDETILLREPVADTDFSQLGDVDVILDYIYGPPAAHLLQSLKSKRPVQYVHIGSLASPSMEVPGAVLRSMDVTIRGAGPGSWSFDDLRVELPGLLEAIGTMGKRDVRIVPLHDVEEAWGQAGERVVFVP